MYTGRSIADICDLRDLHNQYSQARKISRRVIYHSGPPNSGKTYNALQSFLKSHSGIYCCPLRLLANEVFNDANRKGTPCDLLTGEEVKYADKFRQTEANHVSCTVHMAELNHQYETAVIDEMQMIQDSQQGWAWTRAFLGLQAGVLHVCGEEAAVNIIRRLALDCGDSFEIIPHSRLTSEVRISYQSLGQFSRVQPGDCIVCFKRKDIKYIAKQLRSCGHNPAVIYGALPPKAKQKQAEDFNRQSSRKNILVSTDAIGMGLNLSIRRIIFYTLVKFSMNQYGTKGDALLTSSHAQHISGRAGRFNSMYTEGEVTTFRTADLNTLRLLLSTKPPEVRLAGIGPQPRRLEELGNFLGTTYFSTILDRFQRECRYDKDKYFFCHQGDMTSSSSLLLGINLPIEIEYTFSSAPLPGNSVTLKNALRTFATSYKNKESIMVSKVKSMISWPLYAPTSTSGLDSLETASDVCTLYMWLGNKFGDTFVDMKQVEELADILTNMINTAMDDYARLSGL